MRMDGMLLQQRLAEVHPLLVVRTWALYLLNMIWIQALFDKGSPTTAVIIFVFVLGMLRQPSSNSMLQGHNSFTQRCERGWSPSVEVKNVNLVTVTVPFLVRILSSTFGAHTALRVPRSCVAGPNVPLSLRFWWKLVNILHVEWSDKETAAWQTVYLTFIAMCTAIKKTRIRHLWECALSCHVRTRKQPSHST
jgi:hypothetical protein